MRNVYFKTVQTGETAWDVFYSFFSEGSANGVAHVDSTGIEKDVATVVELAAMRYLMCAAGIAGTGSNGSGYHFFVSTPSIDRAAKSVSLKEHLSKPSHFLVTRFKGAPVTLASEFEWMNSWTCVRFREFAVKAIDHEEELVPCPVLTGPVIISRHALSRQVTRFEAARAIARSEGEIDTDDVLYWGPAWRRLCDRLKSPGLQIARLPPKTLKAMVLRYGTDVVMLSHDSYKQVFVFVPSIKGRFVLVTVFPFESLSIYAEKVPRVKGQRLVD